MMSSLKTKLITSHDNRNEPTQKCIIHQSSLFKKTWDFIIFILVTYTAIITPYMTAFVFTRLTARNHMVPELVFSTDPLTLIEYIVDFVFIIDILINFRTTYFDEDEREYVYQPSKIAKNYLKSGWFIVDLVGAIPFQLLILIGNTKQVSAAVYIHV